MKAFDVRIQSSSNNQQYFIVPKDVAEAFKEQKIKRLICRIEDAHDHHCSLMPKKNGTTLILLGKPIQKTADIAPGMTVSVTLRKDDSKYGMPMPETFAEVLLTDHEAADIFESLTAGKKRSIIYLVSGVKSLDKQIERALKVCDLLKQGERNPRKMR